MSVGSQDAVQMCLVQDDHVVQTLARRVLRELLGILYRRLLAIVRDDEVCRRLMTSNVGPVVALTYRATIDE